MKKLTAFISLSIAVLMIVGCGNQNEDLSRGKEWVKSDKRGRIPKAVARFEAAVAKEPDNAEAHYLLGYYDENATIERRAEQMVLAYKYDKGKYLEVLIEETLRDRDENVRKSAAKALQIIHKDMDSMIKPLIKTLKSKDSRDRDDAALVLSKLHNHKEVVNRLVQKDVLQHKRRYTRFDAVRALGNIADERAIEPLMGRITALKIEGEEGEEPEVRQAAVVALRKIAKRNVDLSGKYTDIQVSPEEEGVKITGNIPDSLTKSTPLYSGEIISHVINNKMITSMESYNELVADAIESDEAVTFGLPKIVEVIAANINELGLVESDLKPVPGEGIVVGKMTIESKARKMGLEKGETIIYVNNQKVSSLEDYRRTVGEVIARGDKVRFTIGDADKYRLLTAEVPSNNPDLGVEVEELPGEAEGVVVTAIQPRSPAVEAGVRKGQIFSYVVSREKVDSANEFSQLMKEGLADGNVTISVTNRKAIDKLIDVLRNKGLIVRFDAAKALGEIRNSVAVDSLIEMLGEQANPIEIKI